MIRAGTDTTASSVLPPRSKANRKGLLGQTLITMAISVAILVVNMATGIITARFLGPEGRGVQTALILWPQFLAFAGTFGIHAALLYHMKKDPMHEAKLYYASLWLTVCAGAICVAAGLLLIPAWVEAEDVVAAQWLMATTPFVLLFFMHNALFRGREEFHLFNRMRYLVPLLTLAALLLLAMGDRLTPITSAIAYTATYIPVTVLAMIRAMRIYRPVFAGMRSAYKKILAYGFGAYGIDLLGNLILYLDQIILIHLLAPGPLGLYVVAVSFSRVAAVFSSSINMVLYPKASSLPPGDAALLTLRVFKLSLVAALAFVAAFTVAAPFLIHLLYGSSFEGSTDIFRLLVLEVVLSGAALMLAQAFMATGKPFVATVSQAIGVVLIIPLMYYLVPEHGVIGAGWALLLTSVIRLLFVAVVFEWKFRFNLRTLLPGSDDYRWLISLIRGRKTQAAVRSQQ
ncbi:lipopolysaccharide biosynthesis protein [Cohnella thailandensis]|uniref:Oligosaccharide flippase family protein n=1 Tax=Cohnella thailandensis TaxID=557557 RepID=A0A841SY35_9BACL|nr:oligosaccharide flippase family protein [Cohnella thailandensis]MBB6635125.1 oligosaccharide flippase family protein [Cohnella thailandensis]MBP1974409.1 O-antigen/teichoic acid export membrane protein [Cohnella thailandensis]